MKKQIMALACLIALQAFFPTYTMKKIIQKSVISDNQKKLDNSLIEACMNNDTAKAQDLINSGANPDEFILRSISSDDKKSVKFFLRLGIDPEKYLIPALNRINILKMLLKHGANPNNTNALCIAACNGKKEVVELLLKYNAHPNHTPKTLIKTLKEGHEKIALQLVLAGADVIIGSEILNLNNRQVSLFFTSTQKQLSNFGLTTESLTQNKNLENYAFLRMKYANPKNYRNILILFAICQKNEEALEELSNMFKKCNFLHYSDKEKKTMLKKGLPKTLEELQFQNKLLSYQKLNRTLTIKPDVTIE